MDQQQAVEFTQKALARGATPEQVAYVLAERMNAPVEAIFRFVQRVAAQQPVAQPAVEPEPSLEAQPVEEGAPMKATPEMAYQEEEPVTLIQGAAVTFPEPPPPQEEASEAVESAEEMVTEATAISLPPEAEAATEAAPEAGAAEEPAPANGPRTRGRMAALYQNQAVQEEVLQQLKRHRNPSDIAYKLSEQYGVRWHDAERFVAEIAMKNQGQLRRKTNFLLLFFSAVSLIAGLALLVTGVLSLMEGMLGQPSDRMSQVFGTLVGGGLLTLGGAIGVYITIRPPRG